MQIDRRLFLITGSAGLVLAVAGCAPSGHSMPGELGMWLSIAPNDVVTVRVNATDIGQGAQTGLAQIVADELDADWSKIRIEMAPVTDRFMVKNADYFTGGSSSIRGQFESFAKAGATARAMLIAAAADRWSVDPSSCTARSGMVLHESSNRSLSYGVLAGDARKLAIPDDVPLKQPKARNFVGRPMPRADIPDKVNGRAQYGVDVKLPGMLYATLVQCPNFGGQLRTADKRPALAIRGVLDVLLIDEAIVVVADKFWIAKKALAALKPEWSGHAEAIASDADMQSRLSAQIGAPDTEILTVNKERQNEIVQRANTALASGKTFEAEYSVPLLSHAPMEPMNATARATTNACDIWVPTQNQKGMRDDIAKALGLPTSAVTVHTTKVGGGFGRRLETDYGVFAALASQKVGRPIKLIWSREEDFTHDFYRPASVSRLRAALAKDGAITAIDYVGATSNDRAVGGIATNYPGIDVVIRQKRAPFPLPIGAWRSVDPSITVFFLESFVDEVAHASSIDPLEYRRRLLKNNQRGLGVLERVAQMASWGHAPAGRSQGLALFASDYWGTTVAEIVELSVDSTNKITLHRVYCAIDPGLAVNPNQVKAQAEGGILLGLSAALGEAITLKDGRVEQSNFDSYEVLRLRNAPDVEVEVLETEGVPVGGAGEPPVPPAAPALANALFAATGRRIRALPIVRSGFTV